MLVNRKFAIVFHSPISFAVFGVTDPFSFSAIVADVAAASSFLIVDVDVDLLLKPLVRGARCVSFNSAICQLLNSTTSESYVLFVNFQDIVPAYLHEMYSGKMTLDAIV